MAALFLIPVRRKIILINYGNHPHQNWLQTYKELLIPPKIFFFLYNFSTSSNRKQGQRPAGKNSGIVNKEERAAHQCEAAFFSDSPLLSIAVVVSVCYYHMIIEIYAHDVACFFTHSVNRSSSLLGLELPLG
jgi:hypothetical protein